MFSKNIEVLKNKNPMLVKQLQEISLEEASKNIEVHESESKNLIISYCGLALDDIYDPMRVAKTTWNVNVDCELNKHDIVVVYGLGLGYLFKRAYVNSNCRVLLYEPKLDIMRFVLQYVDFSDVLADDRVYITCNRKDCLNFLAEKYLSTDKLIFLYPKAYELLDSTEMLEFTNDIVEVCSLKKMDITTIKMLAKKWATHSLSNLINMKTSRPISWFNNSLIGKTALIVGAGPSLKHNIEYIKQNRDKFIIFAVNRPLKYLFENGVTPDFAVVADITAVENSFMGIEDKLKDIPIISDTRANKIIYEQYTKILNYNSKNDLISSFLSQITNGEITLFETAGSAVIQAYYAAKTLGITKMVFAGLDLALMDNEIYADGLKVDVTSRHNEQMNNKGFVKIKDLHGKEITTREDYALFVRMFSEIFAVEKDIQIFNLSSFGAYIEGMNYKTFEEIEKDLKDTNLDIKEITNKFFTDTQERWKNVYDTIQKVLTNEKITLSDIKEKTEVLLNKEKPLLEQIQDKENFDIEELGFDELSDEFVNLSKLVINDAFLSQYFQSEFANFVATNDASINQGVDAFKNLKKLEVEILQGIVEICQEWYDFINSNLKE